MNVWIFLKGEAGYFKKIRKIKFLPFWQTFLNVGGFWLVDTQLSLSQPIRSLPHSKKFAKICFDAFFENTSSIGLLIHFTLFYPHRYTDLTWIKDVHTRLKCNPPNYLLICDSLWVIPLEFFNQQCSFPIYSPLFSLISSNVSNFCHLVLVSGQLDVKKVSVVRILFGISKLTRLHFKHVCTPFIQVRSV